MARPNMDADVSGKLKPGDRTQVTPNGTKIGLLRPSEVLPDFKKIVRGKRQ